MERMALYSSCCMGVSSENSSTCRVGANDVTKTFNDETKTFNDETKTFNDETKTFNDETKTFTWTMKADSS